MAYIPRPYNPAVCGYYGSWPSISTKPTIKYGSGGSTGTTSQAVGYLQSVLKCTSNQPLSPTQYGPWKFDAATRTAVRNFQAWWELTVDGVVGPQTWGFIDWAAYGFPT